MFQYIKKIFKLYFFWSLYLIVVSMLVWGTDYIPVIGLLRNFFLKGFDVLWYMWGLIIVIPIFSLLAKNIRNPVFYLLLSFGALIFQKVVTHYGYQTDLPFYLEWCRSVYAFRYDFGIEWILKSVTYISIGTMFATGKHRISPKLAITLIAIGIIAMHFETNKGVAFGLPLIAIGTFPLVNRWKVNVSEDCSLLLRRMSSLIYFIHVSVIILYRDILNQPMSIITWMMILTTCIIVSLPVCKYVDKHRDKWISQFV